MASKLLKIPIGLFFILGSGILFACSKKNNSAMSAISTGSVNETKLHDDTVKNYLALGDSYTIGQSVSESDRYPVQTVTSLNKYGFNFSQPEIIATSGWTTIDLQAAMDAHQFTHPVYDIVTLLIGVNDQYQGASQSDYQKEFTTLLQRSIALTGGKANHVVVLSIPDYSVMPFSADRDKALIADEIDAFNVINKAISSNLGANYLDITGESRKAATDLSLIASDGLHYTGKEYAIWAAMLAAQIEEILK
jgi:lysophospholipase L1-like esterase